MMFQNCVRLATRRDRPVRMLSASYYSSIRERGPMGAKEWVCKLLCDQAYLPWSNIASQGWVVKLVNGTGFTG